MWILVFHVFKSFLEIIGKGKFNKFCLRAPGMMGGLTRRGVDDLLGHFKFFMLILNLPPN